MKRFSSILPIMAIFVIGAWTLSGFAGEPTVADLSGELMCTCGCTMVVKDCNCGSADQIRDLVREKISAGLDKSQILDYFVAQYGEKILAAPTKKGFNLTAWITPFAALLIAGVIIAFLIHAWVTRTRRLSTVAPETILQQQSAQDRARLKKELDQLDI